ncbi:MAG: hypothetical protein M3Y84_03080 [Acidobacteriota bacterium]|nr:hypothetical protein [Acidobacteriota bacterium]
MKLCPQCDFIYEDDQSLCDMDGSELINHSGPVVLEGSSHRASTQLEENPWAAESLSVSGVVAQQAPSETRPAARFEQRSQRRSEWKRFALTAAAVILGVLLFLVYHLSRQNISKPETQNLKLDAPSAVSTSPVAPAASDAPAAVNPSSEALAQHASEAAAANVSNEAAENNAKSANMNAPSGRARNVKVPSPSPASSPPPSRELAANKSQPANVGATKDANVGRHEPVAPPKAAGDGKPATHIAQNQPKVVKPEDPKAKKESKVSSFFKKAGRVLKKPF